MRLRPATRRIDEDEESAESGPRRRCPSLEIELDALRSAGEIAADLPTLRRFADYEVLGRLAVGGMAEVFLARERGQAESARHLALKVVRPQLAADPEFAEMFLREGKVALGMRHPNVCHVYRFGMEHGHPFLAMELVHGVTLHELRGRARRNGGPLPAEIAVKIAAIVAEALHSAHVARDERGRALGIVHQDVSPHNVMVAYDGTVKLLDFGVASTSSERAVEAAESSQTMIRGKAGYLSPEQCTGAGVDARSDIFSLGIVLYEMLTGDRLFARAKGIDSIRAIASEPLPEWPESLSPALVKVLERALARDPEDRYRNAAEMQEELERTLADSRVSVTSAKIAEELARLLGDDFGRAPKIETSPDVADWLRSPQAEASVPVATPRRARTSAVATAIGAIVLVALMAIGAAAVLRGSPDAPTPTVANAPIVAPEVATLAEPMPMPPIEAASAAIEPAPAIAPSVPAPAARVERVVRARRAPAPARELAPSAPSEFVDDPGF